MKAILLGWLISYSFFCYSQENPDSVKINSGNAVVQDNAKTDTIDRRSRNMYGDLRNDDPRYNRRYSTGLVLARVTSSNVFGWAYSRYIMKEEWAEISIKTVKNNF